MPELNVQFPASLQTLSQLEACRVAIEDGGKRASDDLPDMTAEIRDWLTQLVEAQGEEATLKLFTRLADEVPVFELEFADQPSPELLTRIVHWLRESINPLILVRTHVQRSLIGGVRVRTGRHVYDLSLATSLRNGTSRAVELMHG